MRGRRKMQSDAPAAKVAVGYVRVSTGRQADEGLSLEFQRVRIAAWCQDRGYALLAIYEDAGISAKAMHNRPGLQAALDQACAERAALVCYSMSRASRSIRDLLDISERLNRAGADLVSLSESIDTTGPYGRFGFHVLAAVNQLQREIIAETTRENLRHAAARGQHVGRPPRGLRLVNKALVIEDEDAVRLYLRACELRGQGLSYAAVADRLTSEGFKPARGAARFSPKVARDLVRSRAFARAVA